MTFNARPTENATLPSRPLLLALDPDPVLGSVYTRFFHTCADPARYDVAAVTTAAAVLNQINMRQVPLLVTNYRLDGTTDLQLTSWVKQIAPAMQVLLVTAIPVDFLPPALGKYGITGVPQKPFHLDAFTYWCAAALQTWETQRDGHAAVSRMPA